MQSLSVSIGPRILIGRTQKKACLTSDLDFEPMRNFVFTQFIRLFTICTMAMASVVVVWWWRHADYWWRKNTTFVLYHPRILTINLFRVSCRYGLHFFTTKSSTKSYEMPIKIDKNRVLFLHSHRFSMSFLIVTNNKNRIKINVNVENCLMTRKKLREKEKKTRWTWS